jgi:preprotein translocase subunit YajC
VNELAFQVITQAPANAQGPSCLASSLPFVLMLVVFYFFLIRPQQKQQQAKIEALARLKKGDTVLTSGGIIGTIVEVQDQELKIEIAPQVKVRVLKEDAELYQVTGEKA